MGSYAALEVEADSGESKEPEASTTAGPLSPPSPDTRETEARCGRCAPAVRPDSADAHFVPVSEAGLAADCAGRNSGAHSGVLLAYIAYIEAD